MSKSNREIGLCLVGDYTVEKTSLIRALVDKIFPFDCFEIPIKGFHSFQMECDGVSVCLGLTDTESNEDYDKLRSIAYSYQHCVLLYFKNIITKWLPEVRHYCPKTPLILIGTETDLREAVEGQAKDNFINRTQGEEMAAKISALKYVECYAGEFSKINEVVLEITRVLFHPKNPCRRHRCVLL